MSESYTPNDRKVIVDAISSNLQDQLKTLVDLMPSLGSALLTQLKEAQSVEQLVNVEHTLIMLPGGLEIAESLEEVFDLLIGSFQIVGPRKWQEIITAHTGKNPLARLQ
jgi:hypothetical protein